MRVDYLFDKLKFSVIRQQSESSGKVYNITQGDYKLDEDFIVALDFPENFY